MLVRSCRLIKYSTTKQFSAEETEVYLKKTTMKFPLILLTWFKEEELHR